MGSSLEIVHQIKNYIFSHAGISNTWWDSFKASLKLGKETDFNVSLIIKDFEKYKKDKEYSALFDVGYLRGGWRRSGGIVWADFRETANDFLTGYHQIVGHTGLKKIVDIPKDMYFENGPKSGSIIYIDVIGNESLNIKDMYLILDIKKGEN